jgi:hypothetical protein
MWRAAQLPPLATLVVVEQSAASLFAEARFAATHSRRSLPAQSFAEAAVASVFRGTQTLPVERQAASRGWRFLGR